MVREGVNAENCARVQNVQSVIRAHNQYRGRKIDASGITEGEGCDIREAQHLLSSLALNLTSKPDQIQLERKCWKW